MVAGMASTSTGAHPTIAKRIVEEMSTFANLIDAADAATFATDEAWTALQRLLESLEAAAREAQPLRPTIT
jgi:hypothetical protein